jgi:hypothetical protein
MQHFKLWGFTVPVGKYALALALAFSIVGNHITPSHLHTSHAAIRNRASVILP